MKFFSKGVSSQYTYDALASCVLNLAQNNVLMYLDDLGTPRQERLYPVANVQLPPTKVAKVVEKVLHKFTDDIMHRHAVPDSMWSVIVHYPSKAVTVDVKRATVELINELNSTFHYPHLFGALAEWDEKKTTVDWWVKLLCEISPRWAKLNQKLKGETVMNQTLNANALHTTPAPLTVQLNLTATYERKDVADYSYYAEVRYKLSDGRMLNTHNINIVINKFTHEFMYAYINTLVDNKFLISKDELSDSLWADAQEFFNEHYAKLNTHVQAVLEENNLTPQQYEMKYFKPVTIKLIGA